MPARPEDDKPLPPPTGRLAASTSAPPAPMPLPAVETPPPPPPAPVPLRPATPPTNQLDDKPVDYVVDPVSSLGEPPVMAIWGPPQPMTSYSLRTQLDWQRWMKGWTGIVTATDGLPEGVLPKVMGNFLAENLDEIRRRAFDAVHNNNG